MHTAKTIKHWSHHLHDSLLTMGHHIDQHLRSRHFWAGVGITLLIAGFVTLLVFAVKNAPFDAEYPYGIPYAPYRF